MTSRRGFMQMLAGGVLVAVTPVSLTAHPRLHGDGIHDDTEALQALLDGEIIEVVCAEGVTDVGWEGSFLRLPKGVFRVSETLIIDVSEINGTEDIYIDGDGSKIKSTTGATFLHVYSTDRKIIISNFHLVATDNVGARNPSFAVVVSPKGDTQ